MNGFWADLKFCKLLTTLSCGSLQFTMLCKVNEMLCGFHEPRYSSSSAVISTKGSLAWPYTVPITFWTFSTALQWCDSNCSNSEIHEHQYQEGCFTRRPIKHDDAYPLLLMMGNVDGNVFLIFLFGFDRRAPDVISITLSCLDSWPLSGTLTKCRKKRGAVAIKTLCAKKAHLCSPILITVLLKCNVYESVTH